MSSSSTELNCWKKDTQSSALHVMRCEDSSLLFKMPTEKMQWIQLSVTASINNWQMPSYPQFLASLHENYLYLFFFLNQTILQLDHFFHHFHTAHFSKLVPAQLKCHFSSLHCSCSKIQPCQTPVLEARSPKASLSPTNFTQPPREKPKTSKDHTNEIYYKLPWKCQSHLWDSDPYIFFQFHGSFQGKKKEENSPSKSSFLSTVHMATNPALYGFSRLKNL